MKVEFSQEVTVRQAKKVANHKGETPLEVSPSFKKQSS